MAKHDISEGVDTLMYIICTFIWYPYVMYWSCFTSWFTNFEMFWKYDENYLPVVKFVTIFQLAGVLICHILGLLHWWMWIEMLKFWKCGLFAYFWQSECYQDKVKVVMYISNVCFKISIITIIMRFSLNLIYPPQPKLPSAQVWKFARTYF